jgi:hypothetical protein
MAVLLVTYDLNKAGQDYAGFYSVIKSFPYAKLSESSYAIQTDLTPEAIFNQLTPHRDQNDYVYIITLKKPYIGYGLKTVNGWLEQTLTY